MLRFLSVIMVSNKNCVAQVSRDSKIAPTRIGVSVRLETAPTYQTLENTQFLAA